jgi:phosphoglycolate phosphatase-like HAD superfamily hydrolase
VQTEFHGAIFDVDGVLVDSPHETAWRDALRELMESQWSDISGDTTWTAERFTPQIYQQVMSGKPRMSGARAALDYFEVPDAETRVEVYAERKQAMVIELIEAGEFTAYPDALRFIIAVKERRPVLAKDTVGYFRRGTWHHLGVLAAGPELARVLRRGCLRPGLRQGQAAPRDVPDRRPGARHPT